MASMFWGLKMESGKRYSTTVDKSFHISTATLDVSSVSNDNDIVSVVLEEGSGCVFLLTNLRKLDAINAHLDLNFMTGDKITLFCKGKGIVHLSGYIVPDEDELSSTMLDDEAEEEEEGEEVDDEEMETIMNTKSLIQGKGKNEMGGKRKQENEKNKKAKKKKLDLKAVNDDFDEDSSDEDGLGSQNIKDFFKEGESDDDNDEEAGEESDDEEEEDDEDEDDEEEEEIQISKKKQQKQTQDKPQQQQQGKKQPKTSGANISQNGVSMPQQKQQQMKKEEGKKGQQQKQNQQHKGVESTLTGGVKVKDIKEGNGPICKQSRMATVYYTGRLKSNGKVFDSVTQGSGFKFRVGTGEVIKGWDIGVAGMKVGGKRIITCPPQMGYGQKGAPPQIPPNSTLVFEVELKGVN